MAEPEDVILGELDKFMDVVADRILELANDNLLRPHIKIFKSGKTKEVITKC